jgi:hypothetical protein
MTTLEDNRVRPPAGEAGTGAAPTAPDRRSGEVHDGVVRSDLRQQARQAYCESVASGGGLSGKALGARFGRSERWGRERIAEVRSDLPLVDERHAHGRDPAGSRHAAAAGETPRSLDGVGRVRIATAAFVPPPAGARFVAWLGFVFGSVMSVAANVLHTWLPADERPAGWAPGIAPQVGSAVWPVGLLLSVEVLSRVSWAPGFWWAFARYGGAGTVAVGSALISYGHVREVLLAWGYGWLAAAVGPLVLDGLMVVSGFALLTMSRGQAGTAGTTTADLAEQAGGTDG